MKLGALTVAAGGGLVQIVDAQNNVWQMIILFGAVVGALAIIWTKAARPAWRVLKRVPRFVRKLVLAVDVVLELSSWKDDVEQRLEALEGNPHAGRRGTTVVPAKKPTSS
jgi:hypothetical protein